MSEDIILYKISDIEFRIIRSRRRTLGISVLPDASVIVRVPYRTSERTILKMITDKSGWIRKHRDYYREHVEIRKTRSFSNGSIHPYRGNDLTLNICESQRQFVKFNGKSIEMGLIQHQDETSIRKQLQKAYKNEALTHLPIMLNDILEKHKELNFRPTGLAIRSMKRRWGSCSGKGKITLSSELIKLNDTCIEYVIVHELCHLKHHNHGAQYYKLLSDLFPDWKKIRKEMKMHTN
jgi:predicted metal-dependent hydrolase